MRTTEEIKSFLKEKIEDMDEELKDVKTAGYVRSECIGERMGYCNVLEFIDGEE